MAPEDEDQETEAPEQNEEALLDETPDEGAEDDFGPPFVAKTFGGAFVWAKGEHYVATVLRIKEGGNVAVSTQGRKDMHVMLTGGRAVLEVESEAETDRVELLPAVPVFIDPGKRYRLLAMTEVELFTVYTELG